MERFHIKTQHGDVLVSTAFCTDTQGHETGIKVGDKPWVIVEDYPNQDAAEAGHVRWLAEVQTGKREFIEIRDFADKLGVVFKFLSELARKLPPEATQ